MYLKINKLINTVRIGQHNPIRKALEESVSHTLAAALKLSTFVAQS